MLKPMAQAMEHRGPDDEGIYVSPQGHVGFANRRLAIRDLSPAGHMPMVAETGNVIITYNGEVYNADELRVELEQAGFEFHSQSDTEVILKGYICWGNDIVPRLRGMFAFAILDARTGLNETPSVLIARDHLGVKPIYYWQSADILIFASEIKSLLACGLISREIDSAGLVGYLLTGSVPNPLTIYASVKSLEPSTYLVVNTEPSLSITPTTYWSLPVDTVPVTNRNDAVEASKILLAEAVRIRLVSDVPLGAFLSGGLDSSSVVALMRQATSGPIRTCSMVFEETEYSEALYARAVAEHVGAEHFERVITFNDVMHEFDSFLHALDQPSIDGINTYFVSQTARQAGLTVALSGLGGDELFGGYPNTFGDVPRVYSALNALKRIPAGAAMAQIAVRMLPAHARWGRVQDALSRPASLASAYMTRRGLFSLNEAKALVGRSVWEEARKRFDPINLISRVADAGQTAEDAFSWVSRAELRTYTHHQLLRDTDVMSMAHSLEVRVPFLDRELVSAVLRMPTSVKQSRDKRPKPLLAQAMQGLLPEQVLQRRDKQGFTFPFAVWLRNGLASKTRAAIAQASSAGLIDAEAASTIYDQFQRGRIHWSRVWALAALAGNAA
jgi:asparagine synthase (glutamine-hydrolysing)